MTVETTDAADLEPADPASRRPDPWLAAGLAGVAAIVVAPGLFLAWVERAHALRWPLFVITTLMVGAIAVVVAMLLRRVRRRSARSTLSLTIVIVATLFLWPVFTSPALVLEWATGVPVVGDVVVIAVATALLVLAVRLGDEAPFVAVIAFAAVAFAAVIGVGLIVHYSTPPAAVPTSIPAVPSVDAPPSVTVLVLDGYARSDVIEELYGIDNGSFLAALGKRGFVVVDDARADYSHTYLSLASMLALGRTAEAGPLDDPTWSGVRRVLSGDNALFGAFDAAGYEITSFENAWGGSNCGGFVDHCVRNGIGNATAYRLGRITLAEPLIKRLLPHPFSSQSVALLRAAADSWGQPKDRPELTIAHVTVPHGPQQLTADCGSAISDIRWVEQLEALSPEGRDEFNAAVRGQLECVNRLTLEALDALLAADPRAIVVVTADHGPEPYRLNYSDLAASEPRAIWARLGILLAARMPEECHQGARTPVNMMRAATDCALGTDLGQLPERLLLTPSEVLYGEVVEVQFPDHP